MNCLYFYMHVYSSGDLLMLDVHIFVFHIVLVGPFYIPRCINSFFKSGDHLALLVSSKRYALTAVGDRKVYVHKSEDLQFQ